MNLIKRVQAILLKPKETWPEIETESADTAGLYKNYIMILAAIPVLAGFISWSLFGLNIMGVTIRTPIMSGLTQMVVGYILSLIMIFVLSLIADALAPTFGGQKNQMNALKLVAYGSTAGMVGGIFNLIPGLSMLGIIAALYSIYLIYLGLPVLMKNPPEKTLAYTAVLVVCGLLAGLVIGAVSALINPHPAMHMGMGSPNVTIETPKGDVHVDGQKMGDWGKRMEEASKRLEEARKSGDQATIDQAMKEMEGIIRSMRVQPTQVEN